MEAKTETNASILALRFFESGSALHVARMVDTLPDARATAESKSELTRAGSAWMADELNSRLETPTVVAGKGGEKMGRVASEYVMPARTSVDEWLSR